MAMMMQVEAHWKIHDALILTQELWEDKGKWFYSPDRFLPLPARLDVIPRALDGGYLLMNGVL